MLAAPLLLSAALAVSSSAEPLTYSGQQNQLKVQIPRIEGPVEVDGVLDEPAWARAARLAGFSQYSPVDGRPAEQPTEVLVLYSPVGDLLRHPRRGRAGHGARHAGQPRPASTPRTRSRSSCRTFNDARQALVFAVNPLGVQADGTLVEGTRRTNGGGFSGARVGARAPDLSPDFVFAVQGPPHRLRLRGRGADSVQEPALPVGRPAGLGPPRRCARSRAPATRTPGRRRGAQRRRSWPRRARSRGSRGLRPRAWCST